MATHSRILVAGGGPVGLIVGLVLGRTGIDVTVFDKGDIVHQEPRAATIHAATLDILDDLGVYQQIEPLGLICPVVNYYDQQDLLGSFDHGILADQTRHPWVLQCEQDKLSRALFVMARDIPTLEIRAETEVVRCSQSADVAEVEVQTADGKRERVTGRYLVGADGARSTVRKQAEIAFEGITYGERFMIIGTPYDFSQAGYAYRNYISDPVEWYNLFKITWKGPPGVYRLVVPVSPDEVFEDDRILETCQRKFQRFYPRSEPYEIALYDSYVVSQRVAASFRAGRILLAGDAAHLNSPIGAMGMNSGIHDAVNLASNMVRVLNGQEGEGALDRYVRQRRHVAVEHVQTATIANKKNMEQRNPEARRKYREEMRRAAEDPLLAKKFLMRTSLIDSLRDAARID
jgi:3-(3-hydroxy-phenyl)propionate hydroxylase